MLRNRKNKRYNEEAHDAQEGRGLRYNIKNKLRSERFEQLRDLQELPGNQVNLKLIQRNGFDKPILVTSPEGLDLLVPSKNFVVRDVGKLVGYDRLIDVMDVRTQKNIEMTMKDWCNYYESRNRHRLLNVISLEFSHTDLASQIDSPKIVKLLDWVDLVWPKFLKESQTESTNSIDKMKYPKVQKYCLMSVKGSYTDFHIDFGGTSVWYHILRGKKIFWMAPPTELNLQAFEEWTLSGMQQNVFFGDTVEECFRVELTAGNTFFIPSGWIHAVYTLEDSLVFGGNFLHSFGIENQLKVSRIEDATKVPVKFRYPFYTEILWYVVQHYVYCLTGKSHLHNTPKNSTTTTPEKNSKAKPEPKAVKKGSKIVDNDSATESEHEESDKGKRKKAVKSPPPKKRGRPPKRSQKPPTDDESTEIDTDYEDAKPTKSATCRMTKNSLLRLQYEVDEPSAPNERNQLSPSRLSSKQTKSQKNENSPNEANHDVKGVSRASKSSEQPIKSESPSKVDPQSLNTSSGSVETLITDAPNAASTNDANRLNGWSGANKGIWSNPDSEPNTAPHKIHITKTEINGLRLLVKHLSKLSGVKKNMPNLIRNSRALLDDCKKMIAEHENDDPELAVSGLPVTPELLNPKKSDINQLIEQFFRSADDDVSNDTTALPVKTKSDSSTLTMQHRLKYNQINNLNKVDEKKHATSINDSSSSKPPNQKDAKLPNANKKAPNNVSSPTLPSNSTTAQASAGSVDQPRPKSPPTRPLSNKQYSSRTKNDKSDSSLVLPGSFADLIAATSTSKEAFNVSTADVTSSLFGLTSPSKVTPIAKEKQQSTLDNSKLPKRSLFDIDVITSSSSESKTLNEPKKDTAPKINSPEPPQVAPAKRFITPALNRPPIKEKLIYASAPYVSPVRVSDNQRYPYPWQSSPSNSHSSQHRPNQHSQQQQQHHHQQQWGQTHQPQTNTHSIPNPPPKPNEVPKLSSPSPTNTPMIVVTQSPADNQTKHVHLTTHLKEEKTEISSAERQTESQVKQFLILKKTDPGQALGCQAVGEPRNQSIILSDNKSFTCVSSDGQPNKIPSEIAPVNPSVVQQPSTSKQQNEINEEQKVKKPRGPPKKSKEARQVIETSIQDLPPSSVPTSVIKLNTGGQFSPVIVQNTTALESEPKPSPTPNQIETDPKTRSKPKVKKPKKSKDESSNQDITQAAQQAMQAGSSVIRSFAAAPTPTQASNSTNQLPKAGQQYLISRPVLFNTMPTFSSAHLPHLPPASMPVFTAPIPTSMGIPNMQTGARILWATRPSGVLPPVTSAAAPPPRPMVAPTQPKKRSSKTASPTNLQTGQPDNAALLSLATTALSTAPLPTTPTLSNMGSRLPSPAQAYVVNPNLFAAQQYYNPYMQQIPMVQFAPRDPSAAALMAGHHFRPGLPRPAGQLLFAPLINQTGQPRYLITQPGFMPPRHPVAPMYAGHQPATSLPFAAFQPSLSSGSSKETAKVKKVKTR